MPQGNDFLAVGSAMLQARSRGSRGGCLCSSGGRGVRRARRGAVESPIMSTAIELSTALEPHLGPADPTIHTALPTLHLDGGADVLEFRRSSWPGGTVYVSAGASLHGASEIMMCSRVSSPLFPPLVSRLAAA